MTDNTMTKRKRTNNGLQNITQKTQYQGRGLALKVAMIYNFFSITFIEYIQCI